MCTCWGSLLGVAEFITDFSPPAPRRLTPTRGNPLSLQPIALTRELQDAGVSVYWPILVRDIQSSGLHTCKKWRLEAVANLYRLGLYIMIISRASCGWTKLRRKNILSWSSCTALCQLKYPLPFSGSVFWHFATMNNTEQAAVQFSSVQFSSRWYLCTWKSPYVLHPVSEKFPQSRLWDRYNVWLIDDGPLQSFQGRLSSASSFHTSLLQAVDGVMSLASCPQVVSQAPQYLSSEKQATCEGCLARQSICSVISLHVQGNTPTGVFGGGCQPLTHSSLGFPFHFSLFVASSVNLWGWWHVWSDCHLLRQSSGGHGWRLPPSLSTKTACTWTDVCGCVPSCSVFSFVNDV